MALVLADRVRESSTTSGTGTFTLTGPITGYQSFASAIGVGNTCYYTITNPNTSEWEVGIGTVGSGTLARTTVLSSSDSGSLVTFSTGTKDVFVTYPSEKSVYLDASGNASALGTITSATLTNATGLPLTTGVTGTLPVANGGTGVTTSTGTSSVVLSNSPTLVTPNLGTPSAVDLTNATNLPLATGITGILPVANGGTGLSSLTANQIPYGNGTSAYQYSTDFTFNGSTLRVGTVAPLGGATNPIIAMTGNANQYVQFYIYNSNSGGSASSDFAAYPDNGSDSSGFVDVGVTSSAYSDTAYSITGPNEAYLLGSAPSGYSHTGNLVYATDSTGTANSHQWYVGGFNQSKSAWKMQLTSTGLQLASALGVAYGGTGATTLTGLVVGNGTSAMTTVTAPTGAVVGTTDTQTLTNKRITSRVDSVASGSTLTPDADAFDQFNVTALATDPTIAAPTGTPTDGQKLIIRIKDNGTSRTITWTTSSGAYRAVGVTLPTTTTANKTVYVGCTYNSAATYWDVVAVAQEA